MREILKYADNDHVVRCTAVVHPEPAPPKVIRPGKQRTRQTYSASLATPEWLKQFLDALETTDVFQWVRGQMDKLTRSPKAAGGVRIGPPNPPSAAPIAKPPAAPVAPRSPIASPVEIPSEKQAERKLKLACETMANVGRVDSERRRYARGLHRDFDTDDRRALRYAAHEDVVEAFSDLSDSRKALSDRAMAKAMRDGTSYEDAMRAVGGTMPSYLPTSTPV